jgi:DNA helicase TIP49 (TBP-interacting protein)
VKNYIIYNHSGDILRSGYCSDDDYNIQAGDGEYIIEGIANDDNQKIVNGQVVDIIKTDAELNQVAMIELRQCRDSMLSATDWTQIPDAPLTKTQKTAYKVYRQELRDLPNNYGNITNIDQVTFPEVDNG